ncbi:hypothetical protein [Stappia sediminis]|nr:hypothetical protein [Stappia sediminis]
MARRLDDIASLFRTAFGAVAMTRVRQTVRTTTVSKTTTTKTTV